MPAVTSPPATISTAGSYSSNSQHKRFSTVTALRGSGGGGSTATPSSVAQRASVKGLFDAAAASGGDGAAALTTARAEEGPWSVSVAEARETATTKRRSHKATPPPSMPAYTLYMTTPTHNLTLVRTVAELLELDAKLREGPSSSAKALPVLPALPSVPANFAGTQASGRRILQTISRTLSPGGNRKERAALANITATASTPTESDATTPSLTPTSTKPAQPAAAETGAAAVQTTTTLLGNYLTSLSNVPSVRWHKAWRRFIRVRSDDLESVRVERRVRKVRSDLAQHVKSSVAPTNTNVGLTPNSASDVGEDARTDDDSRSVSGRSTSHSYTRHNARPDVPSRSTSAADPEKTSNGAKSPSVANIPEEHEREATPGASVAVITAASSASAVNASPSKASDGAAASTAPDESSNGDKTAVAKRERRHRRSTAAAADKVTVDDFEMIRVLGKGCAGKVLLVRHKPTKGLFAMKSIHKRHVLAHQELQHTLTEQAVLKRMASDVMDPFVVKLWWSFHDKNNLYLVMDFHPGGDLATQLSRWGRLGRDRARFYAAEIVEGVEGLHRAGVVYRDLKPENVLIGADGHIILSDFGLSKEFPVRDGKGRGGSSTPPPGSPTRSQSSSQVNKGHQPHWLSASEDGSSAGAAASDSFSRSSRNRWADERDVTTTFCGTAEYLAPEVIQGAAYSYEVDWWSFGTMLYEMLTGITPFWADTHADMYVRVLHDELVFPDDRVLDQDTKSILRGLLQRNPMLRMKEPRIKKHPYFSMIEWPHVFHKRYIPPYIPPIDPHDETDTQNFDETFLDMQPVVNGAEASEGDEADEASKDSAQNGGTDTDELEGTQTEAQRIAQLKLDSAADGKSLFDGYSFRGRRDSEAPSTIFSSDPSEPAESGELDDVPPEPELESEDEETAARDAVAALARLESEASADGSMSVTSQSTQPTSVAYSRDRGANTSGDTDESGVVPAASAAASKSRTALAAGGLPAHDTIAETDDEDEDWDMVDVPSGQALQSELNGGKGANLFARGVVDTYRMLRRQESSRLPTSTSATQRPFNRLARRNPSSRRSLARPSNGNLTSASAASLDSSVAARSAAEGALSADEGTPELERGEAGDALSTALPTPTADGSQQRKNGGSPSLASSSDDLASQERRKQRMKKIKRFTTFFEVSR